MFGRYALFRLERLVHRFPWIKRAPKDTVARYNIAPPQPVMVIANERPDRFDYFNWGLIPPWSKDPSVGNRMIYARIETVADKPAYAKPFRRRRCLVPADGFYEWRREPGSKTKTPTYIRMRSGEPFAFAGLWESWHSADGSEIVSCTLITGPPNELVATIHDRMVAILRPEHYLAWLDPGERPCGELFSMLTPYPAGEMEATAVSRLVNDPKIDSPECIKPAPMETLF